MHEIKSQFGPTTKGHICFKTSVLLESICQEGNHGIPKLPRFNRTEFD